MQLSLRSQLTAGLAAFGATTLALTPIAQPDVLPSVERVSAAVQLSAFANPVTALLDTLSFTSEDLFYPAQLPGFNDLFWPASFYNAAGDFVYAPGYFGLVPDAVNQFSFGGLSALINNLSGYIDAGIYGTTQALGGVASSVFNTPFAVVAAAQLALAGDIDAALAELQTQILAPLEQGIAAGLQGIGYIVDNVINNAQTIISDTVPRLVAGLIEQVTGAATYLFNNVVQTATTIVTSLAGLDIEGAWNAAVNGLLGPDGLLGSVEQLTVGIGIVQVVENVETVVVPSVRSTLTSSSQRLGDFSLFGDGGILNDPFIPTAAATLPAAAAPAEVPAVEAPAAEVTAAEVTAAVEAEAAPAAEAVDAAPAAEAVDAAETATGSASSARAAAATASAAPASAAQDGADSPAAGSDAAPAESDAAPAESKAAPAGEPSAESAAPATKRERSSARTARAATGR